MNAAFFLYTALMLLEGVLAWLLSGQGFLLAAAFMGVAVYASVKEASRPVAEGVRFATALVLAVAGPFQYEGRIEALLLCFIALPHYLAATQAMAEHSGTIPSRESPGMRSMVFTVAFYTSMGLVLLLARGLEPALSRSLTNSLAVVALVIALPAWDLSRIPRLRAALPPGEGFSWGRFLLPAMLLALAAVFFSGPLPMAADLLCRLSPHWRMNPVEFKNKPPKPPPSGQEARPSPDGEATRLGVDESSVTGEHRLPPRSNLQSSEDPRFFIQPDPPTLTASLLAQGPVYVRSHTLNRFRDNKWTPEVSGGTWIEDAADGKADGIVTLAAPPPPVPAIPHDVFAFGADGYTVPALAGVTAIHLPRVYAVPGEVLQSPATGDIRYRAVSAPALYQALPNRIFLDTAPPEDRVHLIPADGELGLQLQRLADSIFGEEKLLTDRIDALHSFFDKHYEYSTVMKNPHQLGALENFLFDERRGHCDFYASAAALLLRQTGIPSRIAYGFATREADPATGLITARDRHAHAWTEIFLKEYGWTICDFTPSQNVGQSADPATPPPPVPQPDLKAFSDAAKEAQPPAIAKTIGSDSLWGGITTWFQQQEWLASVMRHAPMVLLVLAILAVGARLLRRRRPEDAAAAEAAKARALYEQQPAYFKEFLRLSGQAGHPKPEGRTPLEHYQVLAQAGLPVPPLRPLIHYHCATRYEDVPRNEAREQSFNEELQAFAEATVSPPPAA